MTLEKASSERILADLRHLVEDIGVRLAGSPQEIQATDFILKQFSLAGATAHKEKYPLKARDVKSQTLQLRINGEWCTFPCSLFSSVPGTNGETIEAPLIFFEAPVEYQRKDLSFMKGKAVVHLGCHIESGADYKRLMDAEPAFLMFVDIRHPGVVPLADGMFPEYSRAIGARPVVNVAFMDAWKWKEMNADAARLNVDGGMRPGEGYNVIAELPGTDQDAGVLYASGHHDTQADTPGADDNGSGTVIMLELARLLAGRPRKRTIRLCAFGAEEQLSVGSSSYVRAHREDIEKNARLMLNFDSCGATLGWIDVFGNGPEAMFNMCRDAFDALGRKVNIREDVIPYTDQYPFAVCGVPGIWVSRSCCSAGRIWHHRWDDDMRNVSGKEIALLADFAAYMLDTLANAPEMPFGNDFPADQKERIATMWADLYGGWKQE